MSALSRAAAAVLSGWLWACTPGQPAPPSEAITGFPAAVAQLECGPADGPATVLYLGREPTDSPWTTFPYVQVTVYDAPGNLAGAVLTLDGRETGSALWCRAERDCVPAGKALVAFLRPMPADTVAGWVDLTFPGLPAVLGRFTAPWREPQMLCG
jgi:hypothetical protein